jgi:CRP-like cAMP-binding protein
MQHLAKSMTEEQLSISGQSIIDCHNRLLNSLRRDALRALLSRLEYVNLAARQRIHERKQPISHVYFPCDAVLSVLVPMESGAAVEIGAIGNEGCSGIDPLIGLETAGASCICQIAGRALRMRSADFREAMYGDLPLQDACRRFLQVYLAQVSQSVACNRLHSIQERFARWALMTQDRVGREEFQIAQDFLASLLGVHRPSLGVVAGTLQDAGFVSYNRGCMKILDRVGLEQTSCECYQLDRAAIHGMMGSA